MGRGTRLRRPHTLHDADPVRKRMSAERQSHSKVLLDAAMLSAVVTTLADCRNHSDWRIAAASIEPTHTHLLLTFTRRDIDNTIKWLKDQTTKAVHRCTTHTGPVWCKGRWRSFVFDPIVWRNVHQYIDRHHERRGAGPQPFPFIDDIPDP